MRQRDDVKKWYLRASLFFFTVFIETIALFAILWLVERFMGFKIYVGAVDGFWVYFAEAGGFLFALVLIANAIGEIVRYLVARVSYKKLDLECCDDVICIGGSLPMCSDFKR